MAAVIRITGGIRWHPVRPSNLLLNWGNPRLSPTRQTNLLSRRLLSGYSANARQFNVKFGGLLLFVGSSVSLGCVLAFRQQRHKVLCENDVNGKIVSQRLEKTITRTLSLKSAVEEARIYLEKVKEETSAPGLSVAVSVDGNLVWSDGLGFADVENHVKCNGDTIMRIASISKALTSVAVAKLYEENKLDIDAPIQQYIPTFPQKHFNGKPVTITTRQLLSHLSGIRHYDKNAKPKTRDDDKTNNLKKSSESKELDVKQKEKTDKEKEQAKKDANDLKKEFYIKEPKTIQESIAIFQDDPLLGEPGKCYLYTTYGYTLISAVVESAAQEDFLSYMEKVFRQMDLRNTGPEMNDKIVYNRSRFYHRTQRSELRNTPYIDNSYKWAGGGFMSNVKDLTKFGNAMLYAYQMKDRQDKEVLPGILKPETVEEMWKKVDQNDGIVSKDGWYGWGWSVVPEKQTHGSCQHQKLTICHTGGAVGASSILLIRPDEQTNDITLPPRGIVVSIILNLQSVTKSLRTVAGDVADIFEKSIQD